MGRTSMAYEFEGLDKQAWSRIFSEYLGEEVVVDEAPEYQPLGGVNDQFNSSICKTEVVVISNGGKDRKIYPVLVKATSTSSFQKTCSKLLKSFQREAFMYEVLHQFEELREHIPKCYYGYSNYHPDDILRENWCQRNCCFLCWCPCAKQERGLIVLEDLTKPNDNNLVFKRLDKSKVPSMEHVKLAMLTLATLHGNWYRFLNSKEEKTLSCSKEEIRQLRHPLMSKRLKCLTKPMMKSYQKTGQSMVELLKNRKEDPSLISKFDHWVNHFAIDRLHDLLQRNVLIPTKSKFGTIIHMDFWINNLMFSEDDQGNPVAMKMLDFQLSSFGHPAFDIIYFCYVALDYKFRKIHEDAYLRFYFDNVSKYLEPDEDITYANFKKEFDDYRILSMVSVMGVLPVILNPTPVELGLNAIRKVEQSKHELIANPDDPEDHPDIRVARDRLVQYVHELNDFGMLD